MVSIPNDIVLKIMSKMDIDTRRRLGIYCKLNVPLSFQKILTRCLMRLKCHTNYALVELGSMYTLSRWNYMSLNVVLGTRRLETEYVVNHYLESYDV
jgi:hypothetical protein